MPVTIRRAGPADAPDLVRLVDALSASEGDPCGHFTLPRALAHGFGAAPDYGCLLACDAAEPVGYALWHAAYDTTWAMRGLYMADLYVVPAWRRRGVGRRLVAALAALARRQDRGFLWWTSQPGNAEAHAFYASLADIHEPVVAHVAAFASFERLAADGAGLLAPDEPA